MYLVADADVVVVVVVGGIFFKARFFPMDSHFRFKSKLRKIKTDLLSLLLNEHKNHHDASRNGSP